MQMNMLEAKSQLSRLVQAALEGREVIIARNGEPVARITAYSAARPTRKPGAWKGKMNLADDWDSPQTNRLLQKLMEDGPLFPDEPPAPSVREPAATYARARRKPAATRRRKARR